MISPITGKYNVNLVETFDSQQVIALYQEKIKLDVARFFAQTSHFHIYQCNDSGFRFYAPANLAGDGQFYAELQTAFGDGYYRPWKWEHTQAKKIIKKSDKVLEVGCGTGYFIENLKNEGIDVQGLELNQDAVEVVRQKGIAVKNELIEDFALTHQEQFDIVCSFQVLEHVTDVKSYIENSLACLKKGGKLIIGVPNNNPYLYRYDKFHTLNLPPHHAGLWDVETFEKLPDFFGFKKEKISVEPLFDIKYQLMVWFNYKKLGILSKMVAKMPNFVFGILKPLVSNSFAGRNIVAIYEKN